MYSERVSELLRLVGVKHKYIDGDASDYEKLCVLCRSLRFFEGNAEARKLACDISEELGRSLSREELLRMGATSLWNEYNALYYGMAFCGEKSNFGEPCLDIDCCVEKNNYMTKAVCLGTLIDRGVLELPNTQDLSVYAEFEHSEFSRPSAYACELERQRFLRGEKYNKNVIMCQIIFDAIYKNKCRKIQIYADASHGEAYISELIKYALLRRVSTKIFVVIDGTESPETIKKLCLMSSDECFVAPALCADIWRGARQRSEYVSELAIIYPLGRIEEFKIEA